MRFTSCFVGIPLPDQFQTQFEETLVKLESLLPSGRLVRKQTPHITLYYLDEQSQDSISLISNIIEQHRSILNEEKISIGGLGVFDPEFVRVLFTKVQHGEALYDINKTLCRALSTFYAGDNDLRFYAHVTMARLENDEARFEFKQNEGAIAKLLDSIQWDFEVAELVLYGVDSTQEIESHTKLAHIQF